jgi:hypothetical protein
MVLHCRFKQVLVCFCVSGFVCVGLVDVPVSLAYFVVGGKVFFRVTVSRNLAQHHGKTAMLATSQNCYIAATQCLADVSVPVCRKLRQSCSP